MLRFRRFASGALLGLLMVCRSAVVAAEEQPAQPASAPSTTESTPSAVPPPGVASPFDPKDGDVPLPAEHGWNASLVLDNGKTGIWTVKAMKVFDRLGCPEVVGVDDKGRVLVMTSYSGRWTPIETLQDGSWLGSPDFADVDPDIPGSELYVGSKNGNLYEVVPHSDVGILDNRLIASVPGQAMNLVLGGDFDPTAPGAELLAFGWPAGLYVLGPTGRGSRFEIRTTDRNPERVRDAIVLPAPKGDAPEILTVSRNGHLMSLRFAGGKPTWRLLHSEPMGMGRLALAMGATGGALVLYTGLDDGRVLRHERNGDGPLRTETIYLGPQGVRGLVTGRFDADPTVETVAVFGYSARVELLSKREGKWSVETIFRDRDKGHWLSTAEVDGRNGTSEILATGYGGRIVLLSRPPGYGRTELRNGER